MSASLHRRCKNTDACPVCSRRIYVPGDEELLSIPAYYRLAVLTAALARPRRDIPNWVMGLLSDTAEHLHRIDGAPFTFTEDAFDAACNDDGTFRWLSALIAFAANPPKQRPHRNLLPRLRLLTLAHIAATRPDLAIRDENFELPPRAVATAR